MARQPISELFDNLTLAGGCCSACRKMTSVHTPGPVRSRVSLLVLLLNTVVAWVAMWSQISRSAGWPGAPAKTHCNTCRGTQRASVSRCSPDNIVDNGR